MYSRCRSPPLPSGVTGYCREPRGEEAAPRRGITSTPLSTCALGPIIAKPVPSYAPVLNEMSEQPDRKG
jgi:hypothetical protein